MSKLEVHDQTVFNNWGEIRRCECGGLEIITGPLSLHLAPKEVNAFFELVTGAVDMIIKDTCPKPKTQKPATKPKRKKKPRLH